MDGKMLGKITRAEFGKIRDYPFMMGLQLDFYMDGCGVGSGGKYTYNTNCYDTREVTDIVIFVVELLNAAKVNNVSELKGKPVEITLKNNTFEDFRILTEVI